MGAGPSQQFMLAPPETRPITWMAVEPRLVRREYLEDLADLESMGVFAPLRLGEALQGHLIVEHGRWVGEGLRVETDRKGVWSSVAEVRPPHR